MSHARNSHTQTHDAYFVEVPVVATTVVPLANEPAKKKKTKKEK